MIKNDTYWTRTQLKIASGGFINNFRLHRLLLLLLRLRLFIRITTTTIRIIRTIIITVADDTGKTRIGGSMMSIAKLRRLHHVIRRLLLGLFEQQMLVIIIIISSTRFSILVCRRNDKLLFTGRFYHVYHVVCVVVDVDVHIATVDSQRFRALVVVVRHVVEVIVLMMMMMIIIIVMMIIVMIMMMMMRSVGLLLWLWPRDVYVCVYVAIVVWRIQV